MPAVGETKIGQSGAFASTQTATVGEQVTKTEMTALIKRCHIISQGASMLPAGHLPTLHMCANHAPSAPLSSKR